MTTGAPPPPASLRARATTGLRWSMASQIGRNGIFLVSTPVLAHLLLPRDFGLMTLATTVAGFTAIFVDVGISSALIQRPELSDRLLSSAFWANVALGGLATLVVALGASAFAWALSEPDVAPLLVALSFSFLISSVGIIHRTLMQRHLQNRSLAIIEFAAPAVGAGVAVGAALMGQGVWSLVYQYLASASVNAFGVWLPSRWRPRLEFAWSELRSILGFSLNILGTQILAYLGRNVDNLLIGRFLGGEALGYYALAYRMMLYPLQNLTRVVARVLYPVLARVQHDHALLRSAYVRVCASIALITFPMMLGLAAVADPFVRVLFGGKWEPTIVLITILAPLGAVQSVNALRGTVYQAVNRTREMLLWTLFSLAVVTLAFAVGLRWGTVGVAATYLCASVVLQIPSNYMAFRWVGLSVWTFYGALARPLIAALVMFLAVSLVWFEIRGHLTAGFELAVLVPTGVVVYALLILLLDRKRALEYARLALVPGEKTERNMDPGP